MGEMVVGRDRAGGSGPHGCWGMAFPLQSPKEYRAPLFYVKQILSMDLSQEETTITLTLARETEG